MHLKHLNTALEKAETRQKLTFTDMTAILSVFSVGSGQRSGSQGLSHSVQGKVEIGQVFL